jgi:hypothetical protein
MKPAKLREYVEKVQPENNEDTVNVFKQKRLDAIRRNLGILY